MRQATLFLSLFAFWLLLSGHYTPWLVGAGLLTSAAVTLLGRRVGYADQEGHPVEFIVAGLRYWPWLVVEIAKSSRDVARAILDPRLPIDPRFVRVPTSQKTAVGLATYANSITLTPGTITVEVDRRGHRFLVHALTAAGAEGLAAGDMDRRVAGFEGRR